MGGPTSVCPRPYRPRSPPRAVCRLPIASRALRFHRQNRHHRGQGPRPLRSAPPAYRLGLSDSSGTMSSSISLVVTWTWQAPASYISSAIELTDPSPNISADESSRMPGGLDNETALEASLDRLSRPLACSLSAACEARTETKPYPKPASSP
eukprot:scaffold197672_cov26-Tisochrysis_lutea.AAC.1